MGSLRGLVALCREVSRVTLNMIVCSYVPNCISPRDNSRERKVVSSEAGDAAGTTGSIQSCGDGRTVGGSGRSQLPRVSAAREGVVVGSTTSIVAGMVGSSVDCRINTASQAGLWISVSSHSEAEEGVEGFRFTARGLTCAGRLAQSLQLGSTLRFGPMCMKVTVGSQKAHCQLALLKEGRGLEGHAGWSWWGWSNGFSSTLHM